MAVGELDDVEHGLLVEVRLGEHELVGTSLLEERRQPVERASEAPGARVDREPPHDVDPDPAAGRLERALEVGDGRVVTDKRSRRRTPASAISSRETESYARAGARSRART